MEVVGSNPTSPTSEKPLLLERLFTGNSQLYESHRIRQALVRRAYTYVSKPIYEHVISYRKQAHITSVKVLMYTMFLLDTQGVLC